jgi:3'-phosphoadenosine 5'-phosphosulfate sulfotransferase (PAPS reductase)/FAD synthetase
MRDDPERAAWALVDAVQRGEFDDAEDAALAALGRVRKARADDIASGDSSEKREVRADGGHSAGGTEQTHVALHSGGMDSTISTHIAVRWGPADVVVHLDTGTGIDDNEEYVREFARELDVQCWSLATQNDYEEIVREHGFPGPSRHGIMYRRLKERQIQKLASKVSGDLHCWTGVRVFESDRRMRHVEPTSEHDAGRWYWRAPIHDWTKKDCQDYLKRFDLPRNPLWDTLGRSGDCWCGCFGNPGELLDAEAAGHGDHADWLRDLERDVETGDETERWAWGALSEHERRAERVGHEQMTLCSSCSGYPVADGGQSLSTKTDHTEGSE